MYEYKVEVLLVKEIEDKANALARDGWRVKVVSPNIAMMSGVIVTFERERK